MENGLEGDKSEAEGFRGHSRTQGRALGGLHQAEVEMERRGGLEVSGRGTIVRIVYKGEGDVKSEVQSGAGAEWGGHLLRRGHRERLRSWVHEVHLDGWFELSLRCTCGDAKALECRGGVGGRKESEWLLSADSVGSPRLTAARGEARARAWA